MADTSSDIETKIRNAEYDLKRAENDKDAAIRKFDDLKSQIANLKYDLDKAKQDEEYEKKKLAN